MAPTLTLVLLWLGFAGSHLVLSSLPVRRVMVARIGEGPFRGLYSLLAFAFFIPLVWTYFTHKHAGPWLWTLPRTPTLLWTVYAGMGLAFVLAVAGFAGGRPGALPAGGGVPHRQRVGRPLLPRPVVRRLRASRDPRAGHARAPSHDEPAPPGRVRSGVVAPDARRAEDPAGRDGGP